MNPSHKRRMRWEKKMDRKKKKRKKWKTRGQIYLLSCKTRKTLFFCNSQSSVFSLFFAFTAKNHQPPSSLSSSSCSCARARAQAQSIPHLVFSFLSHFPRWTRTRKTETIKNGKKKKNKKRKRTRNNKQAINLYVHTQRPRFDSIDLCFLANSPRTPRRTNLGQIVDNLLLNKMKNKATFETKATKRRKIYEMPLCCCFTCCWLLQEK